MNELLIVVGLFNSGRQEDVKQVKEIVEHRRIFFLYLFLSDYHDRSKTHLVMQE